MTDARPRPEPPVPTAAPRRESWEHVMFAQFVGTERPWHISKLPGFQIPVGFGAICASRESTGSLIKTAMDELPRFAKLCPDCAAIREAHRAEFWREDEYVPAPVRTLQPGDVTREELTAVKGGKTMQFMRIQAGQYQTEDGRYLIEQQASERDCDCLACQSGGICAHGGTAIDWFWHIWDVERNDYADGTHFSSFETLREAKEWFL